MANVWIGVGGNEGDPAGQIRSAWQALNHTPGIAMTRCSSLYQTAPMGTHAGSVYSNAVFAGDTSLPPDEFLARLHDVEAQAGRVRTISWGPRPLDLDLLMYDDLVSTTPRLTLPHPGIAYRRFVLDPLAEISPMAQLPVISRTVASWRERLMRRPLCVFCTFDDQLFRSQVFSKFQPAVQVCCEPSDADISISLTSAGIGSQIVPNGVNVRGVMQPDEMLSNLLLALTDSPVRL